MAIYLINMKTGGKSDQALKNNMKQACIHIKSASFTVTYGNGFK